MPIGKRLLPTGRDYFSVNDFPKVKLWWGNFHGYVQKNKVIKIITHYSFRGKFNWLIRTLRSNKQLNFFFYPCAMPLPTVITVLNPSASATTSSTTTSIQPTSSGMFLTPWTYKGDGWHPLLFLFSFYQAYDYIWALVHFRAVSLPLRYTFIVNLMKIG